MGPQMVKWWTNNLFFKRNYRESLFSIGDALFPSVTEDYVGTEDPVRAYDVFVENLDLSQIS